MTLKEMYETVESICIDLGLVTTDDYDDDTKDDNEKGISVWNGEDEDDEIAESTTQLFNEFIEECEKHNIKCSRIKRNDCSTRRVDVDYKDNKNRTLK